MIRKPLTYIFLFLVGGIGFFANINSEVAREIGVSSIYATVGDVTDADIEKNLSAQNSEMKKMLNSIVAILNILLTIVTVLVTPAMMLASWLMSPDWTTGDLFKIRPILHGLWVIVANITYFIYAVLLIFIALATIFNSQKYGYKQLLPKLALGILLVPLTWWFIQFIISLSSIVTASVINIPMEVVDKYHKNSGTDSWWEKPVIPKETKFYNINNPPAHKECAGENTSPGENQQECISPKKFIENVGGMYGNLMIYSFAIFQFQKVKNLTSNLNTVQSVFQLINQSFIGLIMFGIFGILVIALLAILMMRAIKLWFYAIFSPIMTLKYVIGDGFFGGKEQSDTFEIKEFIGLAFLPAVVGLTLSFGLVIISLMIRPSESSTIQKCAGNNECTITIFGNSNNEIITKIIGNDGDNRKTETTLKIGDIKYTFVGSVNPGQARAITDGLGGASNIIGSIMINIIAIIFVWVAFMAAKNVSKAVKAVADPFESLGKKIGGIALSLPKYTPIPGTGTSVAGLENIASRVKSNFDSHMIEKSYESKIGRAFGLDKKASGESIVYVDNTASAISGKNYEKAGENLKIAVDSLRRDGEKGKDIKEEIAKLVNSLRTIDKKDRDLILDKANIDKKAFEELLSKQGNNKIDKHSSRISEFQNVIIGGAQSSKGGTNNTSSITLTRGEKEGKTSIYFSGGGMKEVAIDITNLNSAQEIANKIKSSSTLKSIMEKQFDEKQWNDILKNIFPNDENMRKGIISALGDFVKKGS